MQERSTRFLIDTNLFIAAAKRGKTRSTELLLRLLDGSWDLVADEILISEYERYAHQFDAALLLSLLQLKVTLLEPTEDEVLRCKQFFPSGEGADAVHAATCLHMGAVLISNDAHFKKIKEAGLIEVWTISEAIENLLD